MSKHLGGITGLVVIGGDSGRGFESQHCILDGHFFQKINDLRLMNHLSFPIEPIRRNLEPRGSVSKRDARTEKCFSPNF